VIGPVSDIKLVLAHGMSEPDQRRMRQHVINLQVVSPSAA
jgi:hypothetical protein